MDTAKTNSDAIPDATQFAAVPGKGVRAVVDGMEIYIGTRVLMQEASIATGPAEEVIAGLEDEGKTGDAYGG